MVKLFSVLVSDDNYEHEYDNFEDAKQDAIESAKKDPSKTFYVAKTVFSAAAKVEVLENYHGSPNQLPKEVKSNPTPKPKPINNFGKKAKPKTINKGKKNSKWSPEEIQQKYKPNFTKEEIESIVAWQKDGFTWKAIAEQFNVHPFAVRNAFVKHQRSQ